jgi:four helix bundle protein
MRTYRLACYLADTAWVDAETLGRERLTQDIAAQLMLALGSIRANLAEGYSRSPGRDRARFFEFSLGSTRESREWYRHTSRVLGEELVNARCLILDEITRLLLAIIPRERERRITRGAP